MLGYEMSTSFTERMDADDAAKKDRRSRHKTLESERRRSLKEHFRRLSIMVSNPPTESQCLKIAIMCIKNLKDRSIVLSAERDWLLLENRELVERLQELRVPLGLYSKLPRWEDGRVLQDWRDSKWDVDSADEARKSGSGADVHGHEAYINRRLENVRKKKMQLHAWYKSRNHYEIQGEKGGWCSNSLCPAAPHRIQEGRRPKGDTWFIHPEQPEQPEDADEDDGWREDDDKMMLSGTKCPAENLHRPCTCASTVDRTASPSSAAVKFKLAKHVPMATKNRKNNSVILPAPSIVNSKTNVGKDMDKVADTSVGDSSGFIRPAQPIGDTRTSAIKDTDEVADTTKVVASALGNLLELDPEDLSLSSRKQLYVIQIGKKGETQKISTADGKIDLDVSLVPLRPGKAVMIYKPETGEKVQVVPVPNRSRHSLPTETVNSHQVVSGSESTVGPNSHQTGNSCVGQQVVSGSADIVQGRPDYARHSLPTETLNSPQVVSGYVRMVGPISHQTGKSYVGPHVVSRRADIPQGRPKGNESVPNYARHSLPAETLNSPQVVSGSVRTVGPNSYQTGKSCVGPQVVSGCADIVQGRPRVNINQGQNISGSAGLIDQNLGMMQENVSTVSELAGVGHGQRTVTLNKPQAFPVSVCTTSRNTPKEMIQGDGTVVWGPAGDEQCQYRVTLSNSQVVYGSVRTVWPTSYETGKSCAGPRVVSGPVNIAQGRPTVNEPVQNRARHSLPTETLNSAQVVSGSSASTIGANSHQMANSCVGPQVVLGPANITQGRPTGNVQMPNRARHSLPTETFNSAQVVSGSSASTIGPNSHQTAYSRVGPQVVLGPANITQGRPTGNVQMPNRARHSLPTETLNSAQVVSGSSASTIGPNSHQTANSRLGPQVVSGPANVTQGRPTGNVRMPNRARHSLPTETFNSAQVVSGSSASTIGPNSHQTAYSHVGPQVVSGPANVTQGRPTGNVRMPNCARHSLSTETLNSPQDVSGSSASTIGANSHQIGKSCVGLNILKEMIQGDGGPAGVGHRHFTVTLSSSQVDCGSVRTVWPTSHQTGKQRTAILNNLQALTASVRSTSLNTQKEKIQGDNSTLSGPTGVQHGLHAAVLNKPQAVSEYVGTTGQTYPKLKVVDGKVAWESASYGQDKGTSEGGIPQLFSGLWQAAALDPQNRKAQASPKVSSGNANIGYSNPTLVIRNVSTGHSKPTVTLSQPQAVRGLVSTKNVRSRIGRLQTDGSLVWESASVRQGKPTEVLGNANIGHSKPTVTLSQPQAVAGLVSVKDVNSRAVTTREPQVVFGSMSTTYQSPLSTHEPWVVFGSTSTTYQSSLSTCEPQVVFGSSSKTNQSPVTTRESQEVFGSTSTTCLSPLKDEINTQVVSERAKSSKHAQKSKHAKKSKHTKPVDTPRKRKIVCRYLDCKVVCGVEDIPQDQHTVNVSRHDPHYSVGPVNPGSTDEGAKVDAKMGSGLAQCTTNPTDHQVIACQKRKADGKVLSACSQAAVTQSAPHAVCGPVSSTGLDFRKGNAQDISMVSRQPSGSYCQPTATHTSHQVDPWARDTGDLASGKGKAQASEDMTEEANESGSPITCMLCDEPFNNVAELQSHLIDSHAS